MGKVGSAAESLFLELHTPAFVQRMKLTWTENIYSSEIHCCCLALSTIEKKEQGEEPKKRQSSKTVPNGNEEKLSVVYITNHRLFWNITMTSKRISAISDFKANYECQARGFRDEQRFENLLRHNNLLQCCLSDSMAVATFLQNDFEKDQIGGHFSNSPDASLEVSRSVLLSHRVKEESWCASLYYFPEHLQFVFMGSSDWSSSNWNIFSQVFCKNNFTWSALAIIGREGFTSG